MLLPELPAYLDSMGGGRYKGWIIALFTITAGVSRPFSGKLTDTVGRVPVMVIGTLVCVICGILYPIFTTVAGLLTLRFFHGFSTGFKPTATTAYLADVAPPSRRGEALGIHSLAATLGLASGPVLGSWVALVAPIQVLFWVSAGVALISLVLVLGMRETLVNREPFHWKLLHVKKDEIVDWSVRDPVIVYFLLCIGYGAIVSIGPDLATNVGLSNKGWFFTSFTVSSIATRFLAGKTSDRIGRAPVLKVSAMLTAVSMFWLGTAHTPAGLLTAVALYGLALGMMVPSVAAWTVDLSLEHNRGKALATMYIALEAGIGLGAWLLNEIYHNDPSRLKWAYWTAGVFAVAAWMYLLPKRFKRQRLQPNPVT